MYRRRVPRRRCVPWGPRGREAGWRPIHPFQGLITERRISYVKLGKYVRLQRSILDAFIDAG